jgi:FtsP/CotA-like multicopper oxidase with cupredoxin domain
MEHMIMNTQRPSRTLWRWIGAIAALILVAAVAWNAGARVSQSRAPQPTMDPNMSGMQMSGGQAPAPAHAGVGPAMDPNMPGMQMNGAQQPAATPVPANPTSAAMPGMNMGSGLMQDEPVSSAGVSPATENEGGQPSSFKLDGDVKVFELTARPVLWKINTNTQATAWTYNGTVPGPLIQVTEGDKVRVVFTNKLPKPTTIHWHGLPVPNQMDGVPPLTQEAIQPGQAFTYEFEAKPAGTFMYHSHVDTDTQINIGLFGGFVIDPKNWAQIKPDVDVTMLLNEWRVVDGKTYPAMPSMGEPNFFTINGKTFPDTQAITVKKGQRVRIRFIGAGQFEHPMHLHGMPFKIVATDGYPVPEVAQLTKDVIPVHPGERFDIEFVADNPGQWAFHCHIVHHVTNDDVEPGGLLFVVNVQG